MKVIEKRAGYQRIQHRGHIYIAYRYVSDYGDHQWMIDRDDFPSWAQVSTLKVVYATIRAMDIGDVRKFTASN